MMNKKQMMGALLSGSDNYYYNAETDTIDSKLWQKHREGNATAADYEKEKQRHLAAWKNN